MTAGERLVALSGLSGVSAGQHWLAITTGTGATIFTSQMTVVSETRKRTLYSKPQRTSQAVEPKPAAQVDKGRKNLFLRTGANQQVVRTETEQLWLTDSAKQSTTSTSLNEVFTTRRKTVN